jgi:hypothetical protein
VNAPARCIECAYDLTGRVVGERCPECGRTVSGLALRGGLAEGGARLVRSAARIAMVIAVLAMSAAACELIVRLVDPPLWIAAVFWTASQQAQYIAVLLGAYLCTLVARICPRDSPWTRALWFAAVARVVCAAVCEILVLGPVAWSQVILQGFPAVVAATLALDLVLALVIVQIGRTGGLARAGAWPAWVAVVLAAYGLVVSPWTMSSDAGVLLAVVVQAGAPGAIACAVALRRIAREIHAGSRG